VTAKAGAPKAVASKSAASKTTVAKPSAVKPATTKPAAKPVTAKPTAAKAQPGTKAKASAEAKSPSLGKPAKASKQAAAVKPAASKPAAGKPTTVKPAGKAVAAKAEPGKPAGHKPAAHAGKSGPASQAAGQSRSTAGTATSSASLRPAKDPSHGTPTADKAKLLSRPIARPMGNGQVAGVLQAARSVASRATKVVEVEKERKSHLTAEELAEFREVLLNKRRELVDDMVNLEDEARRTGSDGGSASSAMPIHMADLGSDTWEQEFTLNLIEKERAIVREIDEALDRIQKKTYGTCLATGKSISKARLRVKPWAKYCIEYARKRELGLT